MKTVFFLKVVTILNLVLSAVKFQLAFSFSLLALITKSVPPTNLLVPIIFKKVLMYSDVYIIVYITLGLTPG